MIDYRIAAVMEMCPSKFKTKEDRSSVKQESVRRTRGSEFDDMLQDCIETLRQQDGERNDDDEYI